MGQGAIGMLKEISVSGIRVDGSWNPVQSSALGMLLIPLQPNMTRNAAEIRENPWLSPLGWLYCWGNQWNNLWGKRHRKAECSSPLKVTLSIQFSWERHYKLLEAGRTSTEQRNYSKVYWTKQRQVLQIQATRMTVLCVRATIRYKTNKMNTSKKHPDSLLSWGNSLTRCPPAKLWTQL